MSETGDASFGSCERVANESERSRFKENISEDSRLRVGDVDGVRHFRREQLWRAECQNCVSQGVDSLKFLASSILMHEGSVGELRTYVRVECPA